jgi:hypothetical protein
MLMERNQVSIRRDVQVNRDRNPAVEARYTKK